MPKSVTLRNTNPLGAIFLPLIGRELAAGEEFEVDAEVAGRPPKGEGDIGEGLLSQVGNYALVTKRAPKPRTPGKPRKPRKTAAAQPPAADTTPED